MPYIAHFANPRRKTWILAVLLGDSVIGVVAFGSTASAQSPSPRLAIQTLTINQTGESESTITYEAQVTVVNSGASDFSGLQRVDYQIDNGDKQLAYIITTLQSRQTVTNFHLQLRFDTRRTHSSIGSRRIRKGADHRSCRGRHRCGDNRLPIQVRTNRGV